MRYKGVHSDKKQIKIRTQFGMLTVPYGEVRLGLHDPNMDDGVKNEVRKRMGSDREATCGEVQREQLAANKAKKAANKVKEDSKKKDT